MLSTKEVSSVGLCATCNNSATCAYRSRRGSDAMFCEMFDGYATPESKGNGHRDEATELQMQEEAREQELKGLCINCDNRSTCKHVKPETGVWHCEDYC